MIKEDNPILGMLSKLTDLLVINLLVIVCCLPVFTAGAALTAGHFAALRLKKGEGTVFADFWRSFKENFKQATVVWLILAAIVAGVLVVLWFWGAQSVLLSILGLVTLLLTLMLSLWVYPVLSRFVYSTGALLRTSFVLCYRYLFRTVGMLLSLLLPVLALVLSLYTIPVLLMWGVSAPMYICVLLYRRVFAELEEQVQQQ